jgi:glucose/arabinose dehydrogenase
MSAFRVAFAGRGRRSLLSGAVYVSALLLSIIAVAACGKGDTRNHGDSSSSEAAASSACTGNNAGLSLPTGFCATIFADSIGHARHVVVAPNGTVYVNTWSSRYYQTPAHEGGFLVALRDTNNDGRADVVKRFGRTFSSTKKRVATDAASTGPSSEKSGAGGTGIALYKNYLYAEEGPTIVRYALSADSLVPAGNPESVVTGLPLSGDHPMHPFVIDASGNLFMDSGSATNSCQIKNRAPESPGLKPCSELQTRGGVWRFDANKLNQPFSATSRYATGIRNAVGIALAPDGSLYSTQHGRDQLAENWPKLYTAEQGQNLPAEELLHIQQGADYGWPMCYIDNTQQKLVLSPEYGGDGGKAVGDCASKMVPVAFFPAHWAPDGLMFYEGTAFPERYRGGAFIAFHGSWNRAPGPQGGYQVAFVPFSGGKPASVSGFEKFADGFAEGKMQPDAAAHRPVGLAQAPDGSLYITDDKAGRIWRVTFGGNSR